MYLVGALYREYLRKKENEIVFFFDIIELTEEEAGSIIMRVCRIVYKTA